jgi:tRNA1(Val) A37 N6-methylase TrmN6
MSTSGIAEPGTTDDYFLGDALRILQPVDGLRAGLDAVFLAAAAPVIADRRQRILDAGTGAGVAGLCLARRCPSAEVVLLERDAQLARLCALNTVRNQLSDRVSVVEADLTAPLSALRPRGIFPDVFDHVIANPPFYETGDVRSSPRPLKAHASAFGEGDLVRWIRFLAAVTRPGGTATLVHLPAALPSLLSHLDGRFGGLRIWPLYPRDGAPASRILIRGIKGSRAPIALLRGTILHEGAGYGPAAEAVLRQGAALAWAD